MLTASDSAAVARVMPDWSPDHSWLSVLPAGDMNGKNSPTGSNSVSVFGGQAFKKSAFPPVKYIQGLLNAYCPDITFHAVGVTVGRASWPFGKKVSARIGH